MTLATEYAAWQPRIAALGAARCLRPGLYDDLVATVLPVYEAARAAAGGPLSPGEDAALDAEAEAWAARGFGAATAWLVAVAIATCEQIVSHPPARERRLWGYPNPLAGGAVPGLPPPPENVEGWRVGSETRAQARRRLLAAYAPALDAALGPEPDPPIPARDVERWARDVERWAQAALLGRGWTEIARGELDEWRKAHPGAAAPPLDTQRKEVERTAAAFAARLDLPCPRPPVGRPRRPA
jgi:hypothetical protein